MEMTYLCQPPKRYTFEQPQLKEWVEQQCDGYVLNLFAGKVRLEEVDELRVDIDPDTPADYHMDAYEFVMREQERGTIYDTVLLDPPYNLRKSREKYDGRWIGAFTKIKNVLPSILAPEGRVITLGYDTVGMSKSRGFEKIAVCVVCHGGDHNDTLVVVERKVSDIQCRRKHDTTT
jgi:hypothetical protein